jgi:CRP-like cAMP-binding protein
MSKVDLLRKGFLFQSFTTPELDALAQLVIERAIPEDQYIFMEGSQATSMYVIQGGTVEIIKEGAAGTRLVVAQLTEGAHFGEMAFVDRSPRAAAALAKNSARVLEVKYDDLERIVATQPTVGLKLYHSIATTLCERIRQTTSDLSHLLLA